MSPLELEPQSSVGALLARAELHGRVPCPAVTRRERLWRRFPWDPGPPEAGAARPRTRTGTREWPLLSQLPQKRPRETGEGKSRDGLG